MLESLAQGVPQVAIPVTFEQPGIAARISAKKTGVTMSLADLTSEHLSMLYPSVCRSFALYYGMSDPFVVALQGEKPIFLGRENLVTIHCQECGQRIIESEGANVMFTRDTQTGDRQSFKILCQGCASHHDKKAPTSWIKLHEFVEALADSVGMKAERKSKIH